MMGECAIREIRDRAEIEAAALDAARWGFPREILGYELSSAHWFRLGDGVVFWIEAFDGVDTVWPHLAVSPAARRRWPVRAWLRSVESIARSFGANALGFVDGAEYAEAAEYLRRLGWVRTEYGRAKWIGS